MPSLQLARLAVGPTAAPSAATVERFWSKVNFDGPIPDYAPHLGRCWLWTAYQAHGYGGFWPKHKEAVRAHRWAYEFCVGPIPEGLTIDHLCRTTACVNPDHLEPVTIRVNILRGEGFIAKQVRVTQCPQEHPYDDANTGIYKGHRFCRRCAREKSRRNHERLKEMRCQSPALA